MLKYYIGTRFFFLFQNAEVWAKIEVTVGLFVVFWWFSKHILFLNLLNSWWCWRVNGYFLGRKKKVLQLEQSQRAHLIVKFLIKGRRMPREGVDAPSMKVLKARLHGALSSLVWWRVSLPVADGLEWDDLWDDLWDDPFQLKVLYDQSKALRDSPALLSR